nr:MAG TPA: hypothetical protein [Caudoviricetes sp.]
MYKNAPLRSVYYCVDSLYYIVPKSFIGGIICGAYV